MKKHFDTIAPVMRTIIASVILAVFCFILTTTPVYATDIVKAKIKSEVLGQEREIIIHLPKNYDAKADKRYPVMYALDGSSLSNPIAAKVDAVSYNGLVPETIVVGIPNMSAENRQRDLLPPYMKADIEIENSPLGRADKFLTFIETELMPYMSSNYKVSGLNTISGHSRGGVFVLYSLLVKPDLFQARFSYSPAVWREDNLLVAKTKEFLASSNIANTFLYMSLGEKENDKMKGGFDSLTQVFMKSSAKKIVWYSEYTKDATHQNNAELSISRGLEKWSEYLKKRKQ
jgi:predicted alpha/beta superfamily hydrolase